MTENQVYTQLENVIEYGEIILSKGEYSANTISVDKFIERYKEYELTFDSLSSATIDGDGWQPIFEKWHNEGLI